MRRILTLTCMLASLLAAHSAQAGDYVDTRLNFTLTDENLLVKPGETTPSVPGVRIGPPSSSVVREPTTICHTARSVPVERFHVSSPARHTAEYAIPTSGQLAIVTITRSPGWTPSSRRPTPNRLLRSNSSVERCQRPSNQSAS